MLRNEKMWTWGPPLIAGLIIAALAASIWLTRPGRGGGSKVGAGLTRIKQVGMANLAYTNDFDAKFPPKECWMDACAPYVKNDDLFRCPFVQERYHDPSLYGYCFNMDLSCAPVAEQSSETPLVFESENMGRNAWGTLASLPKPGWAHDRSSVVYVDGHVKRIASR